MKTPAVISIASTCRSSEGKDNGFGHTRCGVDHLSAAACATFPRRMRSASETFSSGWSASANFWKNPNNSISRFCLASSSPIKISMLHSTLCRTSRSTPSSSSCVAYCGTPKERSVGPWRLGRELPCAFSRGENSAQRARYGSRPVGLGHF